MKKTTTAITLVALFALAMCFALTACGSGSSGAQVNLKDGTYLGVSSVLDANVDGDGYVEVQIKVKDGKIVDATYQAYKPDGTVKDENYGKDSAYYGVAQKAISTGPEYLEQFVETGDPDLVDTISGATFLHDLFVEAAQDAIDQAAE